MVVVVCKIVVICEKTKMGMIYFLFQCCYLPLLY
jgi:hypothetical protein